MPIKTPKIQMQFFAFKCLFKYIWRVLKTVFLDSPMRHTHDCPDQDIKVDLKAYCLMQFANYIGCGFEIEFKSHRPEEVL